MILRVLRGFFTLLAAGTIIYAIWQRVAPRMAELPASAVESKPLDPAFVRLSAIEIAQLPLALRWDQPLGSEHGAMTYNAQPFRITRHLGDDLNGIGGQNSDLGDPVYAAAKGKVVLARDVGGGWGKMVIFAHRVKDVEGAGESVWQTVYAHLDKISVRLNEVLQRGDPIGTVGTADGQYFAHLHFEIREGPYINPGVGYAETPMNRASPERFIAANRRVPADFLNPPPRSRPVDVEVQRVPAK